jgi:hypothetical protein
VDKRGPAKVRNTVLKPAFHVGQNGPKVTSVGPLKTPETTSIVLTMAGMFPRAAAEAPYALRNPANVIGQFFAINRIVPFPNSLERGFHICILTMP